MGIAEENLRLARDVYRRLLALDGRTDLDRALDELLAAVVASTDAQRGYLELTGPEARAPRWTLTHGCTSEEAEAIRAVTSRGIVTAALATGDTLHVPFATLDDRFAALASVREQRLEAVLCVPIGGVGAGVLYLEGKRGAGPFSDDAVGLAEDTARHVGPSVERAARAVDASADPTRPFRSRMRLDGILGRSEGLARIFQQIEPFTRLDITMLVTGPTGTGKTQLARAIHDNSPRHAGPFVELNCAAIPEGLIESELFGSMPGAFPGARRTIGKVEAAEGGTLFFDEIAEIPFAAQGKLLQFLASRQYYALGSTRIVTGNVRIIAATNVDLPAMIKAKRFREDLYSRLNVVAVRMPSLAERRTDIPVLIDQLIPPIAAGYNLPSVPASARFRYTLEGMDWPANIRDLRGLVEKALIRAASEGATQIEVRHIDFDQPVAEQQQTFHAATQVFQKDLLRRELDANNWHVPTVATRLDISRAHVYNLINQFSLTRK